jgi:hypothetical protein
MNRLGAVGALALALFIPLPVSATAQRTFVASNGSDASPCSLTQPCRSFGVAVSKTSANGEVIVLDSAGYGPVKITQSVSIIAPAGVYAGITVSSGDGVKIDGSVVVVVLRGLSINAQPGIYGIHFVRGSGLTVEDCEIANFLTGIYLEAADSWVAIKNTRMRSGNGGGVGAFPSSGTMRVSIADSMIADYVVGVAAGAVTGSAYVSVTRSILSRNVSANFEVGAPPGASTSILSDGNTVTFSAIGFHFLGMGGSEALFTAGNNTLGYINQAVKGGVLTPCCAM